MFTQESGIYAILNLTNGKIYVGQARGKRGIRGRCTAHKGLLRKGLDSKHLQAAWNRLGASAFAFGEVEKAPRELLNERERHFISLWKTREFGYNLEEGGSGTYNPKNSVEHNKSVVWSEERREKIRQSNSRRVWSKESRDKVAQSVRDLPPQSQESREKKARASSGKCHTEETKRKISEAQIGKIISEESREKMSQAKKGRTPPNKGIRYSPEVRSRMGRPRRNVGCSRGEQILDADSESSQSAESVPCPPQ
jgi:hypothetical protein